MADKPFDLTKPVQTRDGRKARILATDFKCVTRRSIVAAITSVSGEEVLFLRYPDGRISSVEGETAGGDLVNVPEVTTRIANAYRDSSGRMWVDYPEYEKRFEVIDGIEYVGYVEWTFEDGEPVSCRFVPDPIHG